MRNPKFLLATFLVATSVTVAQGADLSAPLKVGDQAPNIKLETLGHKEVALYDVLKKGPAVVVVLRGFPGYQCPVCSKQVGKLIGAAKEFASKNASVLLVYPGPAKQLDDRAREFLKETTLPDNFMLLTDPDFHFTKSYALRWDAPLETAYPSTFVIDQEKTVKFALVSKTHGGRAKMKQVVEALE